MLLVCRHETPPSPLDRHNRRRTSSFALRALNLRTAGGWRRPCGCFNGGLLRSSATQLAMGSARPITPQYPTYRIRRKAPAMFGWLRKWLVGTLPLAMWMVDLAGEDIVTSDGQGDERRLAIRDLRRVVVATDDSGPWGADVVFLLYSDHSDPAAIFPLEAAGRDRFVDWLVVQPGYRDRELARAMSSTQVASFEVLVVEPNGS